jgi:hypothetical protein
VSINAIGGAIAPFPQPYVALMSLKDQAPSWRTAQGRKCFARRDKLSRISR